MSHPRYRYHFTGDQLLEKTKHFFIKQEGIVYSHDIVEPLQSLFLDAKRKVRINGKTIDAKEKNMLNIEAFKKWLRSQFKDSNIEKLALHYSQAQARFLAEVLCGEQTVDTNNTLFWGKPEFTSDVYEKDGEVYCKVIANDYPIHEKDNPEIIHGHIKGPIEALFKLTDDGFKLQYVSTDSSLLRDMLLGEPISREKIFSNIKRDQAFDQIKAPLVEYQKELSDWFEDNNINKNIHYVGNDKKKAHSLIYLRQLELNALTKVIDLIDQYQKDKITLEDLQEGFSSYAKQIRIATQEQEKPSLFKKFIFFLSHNPTSTPAMLDSALKKINSLAENKTHVNTMQEQGKRL